MAIKPTSLVSDDLLWLLVKKNNRFLIKQNGNTSASVQFSSEPNNLYNLNSYKHSGLANTKTVGIAAAPGASADELSVALTTTRTGKKAVPKKHANTIVVKKHFRRLAEVVVSQVAENRYRPDLKRAALARLSRVHSSLRSARAASRGARKAVKSSSKKVARS